MGVVACLLAHGTHPPAIFDCETWAEARSPPTHRCMSPAGPALFGVVVGITAHGFKSVPVSSPLVWDSLG